ncbi:polyadenylate-binding protein RBP45-like [Papaver somniferum]|uniref:polyadenylate-binding protein RBP45-like n=1 Tax=Papaver somniferum TaxID=3469 RepID=UPI000E6F55D2|nr:polyadenylate-binding protein RBP45-like [Papaver somniferum]
MTDARSSYPTPVPPHQAYGALNMQRPFAYNDSNNTTLFVGHLDINISEEELRRTFLPFGEVVLVKVPARKGCGFVQFRTRASAEDAIQKVNGTMIDQKIVRISWGVYPGKQLQQQHFFYQQPQQLRQMQQIESPFQGVVSSPLIGSLSANQSKLPQQMSSQMQQSGPQKQTAVDHQWISILTPQVDNVAANTMVTPDSPQLSSQTSDSNSISSFSME